MGIFELMQKKKGLFVTTAISLMLLAAVSVGYQLWPQKRYSQSKAYFSDDDGQTWYLDSVDIVPPYDHNGKEAVSAVVFSYDKGSKCFCGYLSRYGASTHKAIEEAIASGAHKTPPDTPQSVMFGPTFGNSLEIKKPNSNDPWIPVSSSKAAKVLQVHSPDGSVLDSVLP